MLIFVCIYKHILIFIFFVNLTHLNEHASAFDLKKIYLQNKNINNILKYE